MAEETGGNSGSSNRGFSDNGPGAGGGGGPGENQQGVQVLLDERELRTLYTNAYRIHTSAEEVIIDLGFNMPNPNQQPQQGGQAQLLFKVTDRAIMSYTNAKRLAGSLATLIKRYEQQFGEIPAQPGQRR